MIDFRPKCDYIYSRMISTFKLPSVIDDGRLDLILKLINAAKLHHDLKDEIIMDWSKCSAVSPAGQAILSCLFDILIEQGNRVKNINISKSLSSLPAVKNLKAIYKHHSLPNPNIGNNEGPSILIRGVAGGIDTLITERINEIFYGKIPENILYATSLIINELMQNSADHSTAERFYIYAGLWNNEFHAGLLDMGISIPAKLEQKYICKNDLEYLELSMQKGSSTRRQRTGGFGLYYFFEFLKEESGKLTLISRNAQIRRYFKTRKSQKNILKYPLPGTWCFARFSLED